MGAGGVISGAKPMDETREELLSLLVLARLPGVGDCTMARLVAHFGCGRAALRASPDRFMVVAGKKATAARRSACDRAGAEAILVESERLGLEVVSIGSPGYPSELLNLTDPPPVLFLRGRRDLLYRPAVAIVGVRRATETGRRMAERIAAVLARCGTVVVSGMARGIDGAAHRGALAAGGDTVAVLGCGAYVAYPTSNRKLHRDIGRDGLLVTEFEPGEGALPHHFPKRNRIIAALARAVIVVEAGRRSGALITVEHALDLGRDVFAVPGSVESEASRGTNALLRDGARILPSPEAIVQELEWLAELDGGDLDESAALLAGNSYPGDSRGDAGTLWEALSWAPLHLDDLARKASIDPARAMTTLTLMELDGWVSQMPGMRFCRVGAERFSAGRPLG
ncbi:MAG: DNA-processing protein DprA [Dehalococcoidia bacterium]